MLAVSQANACQLSFPVCMSIFPRAKAYARRPTNVRTGGCRTSINPQFAETQHRSIKRDE